jgi:hypothetical protein
MSSQEMKQFDHATASNAALGRDEYALAMFRRGLLEGDERARRWVRRAYHDVVLDWLRSHAHRDAACRLNDEDFYVEQTFDTLPHSVALQAHAAFDTLSEALHHLRACLNSVLLEALRASPRPPPGGRGEASLWEKLSGLLPDGRERRLAFLLYNCGLEPGEIVRRCAQEFVDVQEILRLRRQILVRLLRNQEALDRCLEVGRLSL